MSLYRFSPITSPVMLQEAIAYVMEQGERLSLKATGKTLLISYLTIFAHYDDEYAELIQTLDKMGAVSDANNGKKVTLTNSISYNSSKIIELRIRKPDPYRTQVGCCDFVVDDYQGFKEKHLQNNKNLRLIERPEYEMIEFFDPDIDVFAYVVSP